MRKTTELCKSKPIERNAKTGLADFLVIVYMIN